jgi:hypothetical protein
MAKRIGMLWLRATVFFALCHGGFGAEHVRFDEDWRRFMSWSGQRAALSCGKRPVRAEVLRQGQGG